MNNKKITTIKGTTIKKIKLKKSNSYIKQLEDLKKIKNKINKNNTSNIEKIKLDKIKKQNYVKYEYIEPKQKQGINWDVVPSGINDTYTNYIVERCTSTKEKIGSRCTRKLSW